LPAATASSRWDADGGYEILELASADGAYRQTVVLDGADQRWDVRESTVRDAAGKVMWKLQNKDFRAVKTVDGTTMRLPGKTRFEQPPLDADLIVDWKKQELNVDLTAPALFEVGIADGIPVCP
jgi:hypothetical protein